MTEPEKDPLRAAVTALHQWWKDYPTSDATDEEFALWTALGDQLRPLREARDAQLDAAPVAGPEPGPPTSQWYLVSYTFPTGAGHLEVGLPGGWIARSTADAVAQTITATHPQVRRKDVVITGLCPIGPPAPSRPQPVFPLTPAPEETP